MSLVVMAALLALVVPISEGSAASGNVLHNPGFEGNVRRTSLSSWTAEGWEPWFFQDPAVQYSREPEFGVLDGRQRYEGTRSQRWFNNYGVHDAGIWQQASVPRGSQLTFSVWMFSWSSTRDVWAQSDSHYDKWVGIDPTGGTDPFASSVVWSAANAEMDRWVKLTVSARAQGDRVTVFVRGRPHFAVKHNDVLVDEASLVYDEEAPPVSTPVPSPTPPQTIAQPDNAPGVAGRSVRFDVTGHTVRGEWLNWFDRNGGIDNNGLPRSEVIVDPITGQWVQYFQRVVLEWHPENPPAHRIQRRLLGDIIYPGADEPLSPPAQPSSTYIFFGFDPTRPIGLGHGVSDLAPDGTNIGFKTYFESRGGVQAFGFPKEEPKLRDGRWTQRFQAAVFEYHPEHDHAGFIPGTRTPYRHYRVQLELLGDKYLDVNGLELP